MQAAATVVPAAEEGYSRALHRGEHADHQSDIFRGSQRVCARAALRLAGRHRALVCLCQLDLLEYSLPAVCGAHSLHSP